MCFNKVQKFLSKNFKDFFWNALKAIIFLVIFGYVLALGVNSVPSQDKELSNLWINAIILAATFALLCFEYGRITENTEDKKVLRQAGKEFFSSTILFVFGSMLVIAAIHIANYSATIPYEPQWALVPFVIAVVFLLFAAGRFCIGLNYVWDSLKPFETDEDE